MYGSTSRLPLHEVKSKLTSLRHHSINLPRSLRERDETKKEYKQGGTRNAGRIDIKEGSQKVVELLSSEDENTSSCREDQGEERSPLETEQSSLIDLDDSDSVDIICHSDIEEDDEGWWTTMPKRSIGRQLPMDVQKQRSPKALPVSNRYSLLEGKCSFCGQGDAKCTCCSEAIAPIPAISKGGSPMVSPPSNGKSPLQSKCDCAGCKSGGQCTNAEAVQNPATSSIPESKAVETATATKDIPCLESRFSWMDAVYLPDRDEAGTEIEKESDGSQLETEEQSALAAYGTVFHKRREALQGLTQVLDEALEELSHRTRQLDDANRRMGQLRRRLHRREKRHKLELQLARLSVRIENIEYKITSSSSPERTQSVVAYLAPC